jgi:hypothetical protein
VQRLVALVLALSLPACGGGTTTTPARGGGTTGGSSAGNANGNGAGGGAATTGTSPDGFTTTNLEYRADGTIVLGPGFRPTPIVVAGQNGGPNEAYTLGSAAGASCYGYIPDEPQHVVELTATMPDLRVVVDTYRPSDAAGSYGSVDSTLFVRLPSGAIYCDDDGGGDLQPVLDLYNVGPGRVEIFVGAYSASGTGAYYKLALTENASYTHADLR